jgi:integrase
MDRKGRCGMTTPNTYGPETTLLVYFTEVYERLKLGGASANCKAQYRQNIAALERFLTRPATLADLTDDCVTAFLGWLQGTPTKGDSTRSPATVNTVRKQILALWRYAARKRHVEEFPDVAKAKEFKRIPSAWTIQEVGRLIETVRTIEANDRADAKMAGEIRAGDWWTALILTIYDTAIRIGAALQLRVSDYNRQTHVLRVPAEFQKQGADQVFKVSDQTAAALCVLIDADPKRELLFPCPVSKCALYYNLDRMLEAAGLPSTRRDKFHKLRRTSATLAELFVGRGTATHHLGHSGPGVTAAYIDTSHMPESAVATKLPRPDVQGLTASAAQAILAGMPRPQAPVSNVRPMTLRRHSPGVPLKKATVNGVPLWETGLGKLLAEFVEVAVDRADRGNRREEETRIAKIMQATEAAEVHDVDAARVLDYIDGMKRDGWAESVANKHRRTFTKFMRWIAREGYSHAETVYKALRAEGLKVSRSRIKPEVEKLSPNLRELLKFVDTWRVLCGSPPKPQDVANRFGWTLIVSGKKLAALRRRGLLTDDAQLEGGAA